MITIGQALILFNILQSFVFATSDCAARQPELAAAMMVKNERDTVRITMESIAQMKIGTVFVYDTGSTDGTQQLLRQLGDELDISLDLVEGAFVDFATSRNVLLQHARGRSDWLLLLDAGDRIEFLQETQRSIDRIESILFQTSPTICAYEISQCWDVDIYYNVRLIRNDGSWRYEFPVHEYLITVDGAKCHSMIIDDVHEGNATIRLTQNRTISGRSSPARWVRDAQVLRKLVEEQPNNTRAVYYTANTYSQLQQWNTAIEFFKKRIAMKHGWFEEREVSMISLINIYTQLGKRHAVRRWAFRLYFDHNRIEGVMKLARLAIDIDEDAMLCFALSSIACHVPIPKRSLFINPKEYDTYRWNLQKHCRELILAEI